MVTRIKRRRHGMGGDSLHAYPSTHKIGVGFDAREKGANRPFPGKFLGFVIYHDMLGANNQRVVDMEAMRRLDDTFDEKKLAQAKAKQLKAPLGLLPMRLHFILRHDAVAENGGWSFPGTFAESYERWGRGGLMCYGNGLKAHERQDDSGRKEIDCVPIGAMDADPEDFCQHSAKRDCKAHSRLVVCLWVPPAEEQGNPEPLCKTYGWQGMFRLDTSSEFSAERVVSQLDDAARRLKGRISHLPGMLTFTTRRRRTGNEKAPVGIVGQVEFALSAEAIAKRERQRTQVLLAQRGQLLLPGDAADDPPEPPEDPYDDGPLNGYVAEIEPEPSAPEPEPEPALVVLPERTVADATDEELADSLVAFAGDEIGKYAFFEHRSTEVDDDGNQKRETFRVPGVDWFFKGAAGDRDARRRELLRETCLRLEADAASSFELIPATEEVSP
jgi:hypothetical protein